MAERVTLVEFLTARLNEDELIARDADMSPERITGIPRSYASAPIAIHIARHDPARVLREVEAKRRRVELHSGPHECSVWRPERNEIDNCYWVMEGENCTTIRLEALPYDSHPDFREEFRP